MSENPWKNFPKDKPLKSGLYRVEYDCADHHWYQCWYWDEDAWVEENFRGCLIYLNNKRNIRFKPWDDEETVESKVMLTLDEADEILEEFRLLIEAMDEYNYENGDYFYTDDAYKQLNVLRKRIEESETP